jgi:hypothetical protein
MDFSHQHGYDRFLILGLIVLAISLSGQTTQAQGVVNGTATANILSALTVTADSSLRFGNVLQGVSRTVTNASNDSSAVFRIVGQVGATIWASLTLPTYLSHIVSSQDRMDVYFNPTSGAWDDSAGPLPQPESGTSTTFNPYTPIAQQLTAGNLAIFLGGTLTPKVNQTAGAYSADIVLTVAYTGI